MVQHALDRAAMITDPDRIVTVIGPGQWALFGQASRPGATGVVIEQPMDRGSASAVMMALAHILLRDPDATVLVLPAAQFAHTEEHFVTYLKQACEAADEHRGHFVLLGAKPRYAENDLGWVLPSESLGNLSRVGWIRQTPSRAGAARLLRNGALWNTQIFAVRGVELWRLGQRCAPGLAESFAVIAMTLRRCLIGVISRAAQENIVSPVYADMPRTELTSTLLLAARDQMLVLSMDGVLWADWSRPDWVIETMGHLDREPRTAEGDLATQSHRSNRKTAVGP